MKKWAYVVLFSKFGCHFLQSGLIKAYGVILPLLVSRFDSDYATIGLLVSLSQTTYYIFCPIANALSSKTNARRLCTVGGIVAGIASIAAAFARTTVTFGICLFLAGAFCAPINQTSHVVLHEYFKEKFGSANAFTMMGTLFGGILLPLLCSKLVSAYGLTGTLLCLGAVYAHVIPIGASLQYSHDQKNENHNVVTGTASESTTSTAPSGPKSDVTNKHPNSIRHWWRTVFDSIIYWMRVIIEPRAIRNELAFSLLLVPCQMVCLMVFSGWVLYIVSYGISVGMTDELAVFLPVSGAVGGTFGRSLQVLALNGHPELSHEMLAIETLLTAVSLLLYPVNDSFWYLVACSFFAGWGLFSSISGFFAVLGVEVSEENIPGIMALQFFCSGLGIGTAGYIGGKLYDMTNSFEIVFIALGISMVVALVLILIFSVYTRLSRSRQKL